ncbi:hypothetical protein MMAN_06400 [Mycobacterium mantenii]|nr:hypothetical protein [Mycobacterium mantenii]MCV7242799.1 hypothetical protein [Mycobacterium mantenii]BBY36506.1 hypothetical protein MMAN_06400 [Mycobacterium mantenii]
MFWLVGDEEHNDPRFGTASLGLYVRAGSWCIAQVHNQPEAKIPPEWEVPEWVVRGWGSIREANKLVEQGIWEAGHHCWYFVWIRRNNTADHMRYQRKREREKWERKQAKRRNSPGESAETPQESYTGESGA